MGNQYLFVYGTLKQESNHPMAAVLDRAAKRLGAGSVMGRMYQIDWYPGLILDESGNRIQGVLYRLDQSFPWDVFDEYEGSDFDRAEVEVNHEGGQCVAFAYLWNKSVGRYREIKSFP